MSNKSYCKYCNKETYNVINDGIVTCSECWQVKVETYKIEALKNDELLKKIIEKPIQQTYTPHCPTCGSPDIQKISITERAVSVIGFGLLSKKINKTFKCKNCGHTW